MTSKLYDTNYLLTVARFTHLWYPYAREGVAKPYENPGTCVYSYLLGTASIFHEQTEVINVELQALIDECARFSVSLVDVAKVLENIWSKIYELLEQQRAPTALVQHALTTKQMLEFRLQVEPSAAEVLNRWGMDVRKLLDVLHNVLTKLEQGA